MRQNLRFATAGPPPEDANRSALAAAISARGAADRNVANAREAVETAFAHWVNLSERCESAKRAIEEIGDRELDEISNAVAAGQAVKPGCDLRTRMTAEADAIGEEAAAARAMLRKLRDVQARFEGQAEKARADVIEAAKRVVASAVEPLFAEAQAMAQSLGARRRLLETMLKLLPVGSPLWGQVNRHLQHPFAGVDVSAADIEIACWRAAFDQLASDANAPLPAVGQ
jgi:predicted TPR repeat methyltransferase